MLVIGCEPVPAERNCVPSWPLSYQPAANIGGGVWAAIVAVIEPTGCELHVTQPGSIANIAIRPQEMSSRAYTFHEACIHVQAAGLNFRDVLNVLGLDPTGTVRSIGGESAGIVSAAGPACGHVPPSGCAYGLAPGSLRTRAWCDARYIRCARRALETSLIGT